jgi:hypothetical protein
MLKPPLMRIYRSVNRSHPVLCALPEGAEMEILVIAVLLVLSLASFLTAKIAKALDVSYEKFLHLGVLFCFAAVAPSVLVTILEPSKNSDSLVSWALGMLCLVVFDLFAAFESKRKAIPPWVPVRRPDRGVSRTAKEVASFLLVGVVLYFAARRSLPFLGHMSGEDMVACGFYVTAAIIWGLRSLYQRVEICGNGLLNQAGSPKFRPWEAYESFSWTEETKDDVELRLKAKPPCEGATPLMVSPEDRKVVQQILEANLPDELSVAQDGFDGRIICVRVKRIRLRRFAGHIVSALCWPAVVLLLVYVWNRSVSWETFSVVGFVSILITMGVNFSPSKRIEICRKGLLQGDQLLPWKYYECFFWKGETEDGVELRLPFRTDNSMTRLVVAPRDGEAVQQLLEENLQDRSADSAEYSRWFLF